MTTTISQNTAGFQVGEPGRLAAESLTAPHAAGIQAQFPVAAQAAREVLRVTNSIAQYDVSAANPAALANLGKAIAGCLDRDDLTFLDPESGAERKLGDVLVAVNLSDPEEIVLSHRNTAGKGWLGRVAESAEYIVAHPLSTVGMKVFGVVADPEVIYQQKVIQMLAQLDREGLFGPPGASTFNLKDWEVSTRTAWRDVTLRRKGAPVELERESFNSKLRQTPSGTAV